MISSCLKIEEANQNQNLDSLSKLDLKACMDLIGNAEVNECLI